MSGETKGKIRFTGVWIIILIILGILILGDLNRRMGDARRIEQDAISLETQVAALATESVELQYNVDNAASEALVEDWAHSDARLVRDGEILVFPLPPPGATPSVQPGEGIVHEPPSPFEIWLALLFGG
ncbi:MAG: hypothetical protein ACERKX_08820 [Anaerolineales bacterium]|jgi:cell division protein FtsB